jgi:hypothetical protein
VDNLRSLHIHYSTFVPGKLKPIPGLSLPEKGFSTLSRRTLGNRLHDAPFGDFKPSRLSVAGITSHEHGGGAGADAPSEIILAAVPFIRQPVEI